MTMQRDRLADIQYIAATTAASIYANPSGKKTFLRSVTLFNGNTGIETVKLHCVPDSSGSVGTAGAGNQFLEQALAPKETLVMTWDYPIVLKDANDTIQAATTTASKVTVMLHGDTDA